MASDRGRAQGGFVLLEVLVAGALLLVLTGCLALVARSAQVQEEDSCRVQAVFLARAQFSEVEAAAEAGALHAGSLAWLGREEDLQAGATVYKVATEVAKVADRSYQVHVAVSWSGMAGAGETAFSRLVTEPAD